MEVDKEKELDKLTSQCALLFALRLSQEQVKPETPKEAELLRGWSLALTNAELIAGIAARALDPEGKRFADETARKGEAVMLAIMNKDKNAYLMALSTKEGNLQ